MQENNKIKNEILATLCDKIIDSAQEMGFAIRAFGSVGFYLKLRKYSDLYSSFRESLGDIDLVVQSKDIILLEKLFENLEFIENKNFKRLFGYQRRQFYTSDSITIEVYLDNLYLCQKILINERIYLDRLTLCYTDLFLSKIQRIPLTLKDIFDLSLLLFSIPLSAKDIEGINKSYIEKLCQTNWRRWKTILLNFNKLHERGDFSYIDRQILNSKIDSIMSDINSNKKTLCWHTRNLLGEKLRWYDYIE